MNLIVAFLRKISRASLAIMDLLCSQRRKITCRVKRGVKLVIDSQNSTIPPLKSENGWMISSYTFLWIKWGIAAGIKNILYFRKRVAIMESRSQLMKSGNIIVTNFIGWVRGRLTDSQQ